MSSYEELRAKQIKTARRDLLETLKIFHGMDQPAPFATLRDSLEHLELPDDSYVKSDLIYLIDKGYVVWVNPGNFVPWKKRLFRLAAAGVEVVDRITVDPALEP